MQIDLQKVAQLLSEKIGQKVEITEIKPVGSGYHSDGFKLTASNGQSYFLKRVKSHDLGFEFVERKIASLLISDGMGKRVNLSPKSVGLALIKKDQEIIMPELDDEVEIYHLQEFMAADKSYWEILQAKKNEKKQTVDAKDLDELEKITDLIVKIHGIKHFSKDIKRLNSVYNDSLRAVIANPELTLVLLQSFSDDHAILPRSKHQEFLGLMLENVYHWENRSERLCALHGDFWGANLFFNDKNEVNLIDYSRIPWGDPGIDIGWWFAQYLWFYYETGNQYFKDLGEKFLTLYEKKSGDKEIRQAITIILGLLGIIFINPLFYSGYDLAKAKKFMEKIKQSMKAKKFTW